MKRAFLSFLVLSFVVTLAPLPLGAHCEVPCGIYADQRRFEEMLEDHETIAKAMKNIRDLAGKTDPQAVNQVVRWVNTKEDHAKNTQHVIAQYFMAQRIKANNPKYIEQLTAAHEVIVNAMKCKQNTGDEYADSLKESILKLHKAYTAK